MKDIILMLSAGRSGTKKLASLLSEVPGVYAEHEGDPGFHTVRIENQTDPSVGAEFVRQKLAFFNSLPQQTIFHTGHMAGEGFFEHFVAQGVVPKAIILSRPKREVALSMFRLNWIPGRNRTIKPWYAGPDEAGTLPYPNWETAHPYQLCYWWCLDSERRVTKYSAICSKVYPMTLSDALYPQGFNRMLDFFGLPNVDEIDPSNVNQNNSFKPVPPDSYLEKLEQEVPNIDA